MDTWSALAPTDQVKTSRIDDAGLATSGQVQLESHLEEHEGRLNTVLVQFEQVSEVAQSFLSYTNSEGKKITVEPLNKDTFGTSHFVLCSQRGCPLSEVIFYRVCIHEYFRLVLCWEVCPFSECPLSEVSQEEG